MFAVIIIIEMWSQTLFTYEALPTAASQAQGRAAHGSVLPVKTFWCNFLTRKNIFTVKTHVWRGLLSLTGLCSFSGK